MKQDSAKKTKRSLKILRRNGFRVPYQVLVDISFIKAANRWSLAQRDVNELFKAEPKLLMTKCTYEAQKAEPKEKNFSGCCEIIKCGHEGVDAECALSFIKEDNPNHYILATGNRGFIDRLKESKRIPVVRISKRMLAIECNKLKVEVTHESLGASKSELRHLKRMFG